MKKNAVLGILVFTLAAAVSLNALGLAPAVGKAGKKSILHSLSQEDLEQVYKVHGVKGALIIYDQRADVTLVHNPARTEKQFLPASTFKIANSLIALETGVVKDEKEVFKWDGKKRFLDAWNRDHNLRGGMKYSVVWLYRELARRIGEERMQRWVNKIGYGNKDISGGIDKFWLEGGLRISPREQIAFLKKLYYNKLPFSRRTMDIVKELMVVDKGEKYVMRAKTGWAVRVDSQIGWYVGWLETGGNVYFFANNIDIVDRKVNQARIKIVRDVFKKLGLLPKGK